MDLALNNLRRLICHKTQQTKPNLIKIALSQWTAVTMATHWVLKWSYIVEIILESIFLKPKTFEKKMYLDYWSKTFRFEAVE